MTIRGEGVAIQNLQLFKNLTAIMVFYHTRHVPFSYNYIIHDTYMLLKLLIYFQYKGNKGNVAFVPYTRLLCYLKSLTAC